MEQSDFHMIHFPTLFKEPLKISNVTDKKKSKIPNP